MTDEKYEELKAHLKRFTIPPPMSGGGCDVYVDDNVPIGEPEFLGARIRMHPADLVDVRRRISERPPTT